MSEHILSYINQIPKTFILLHKTLNLHGHRDPDICSSGGPPIATLRGLIYIHLQILRVVSLKQYETIAFRNSRQYMSVEHVGN
jgi:hypothetical protein